jgi:hypothetical protein
MKFRYDSNNEELVVSQSSRVEYHQLNIWLTRHVKGYRYMPAFKMGVWNGQNSYFRNGKINLGLWKECFKACKEIGTSFVIENKEDFPINREVTLEKVQDFCKNFFKEHKIKNKQGEWIKFTPYDHQIDAAYKILKNRFCMAEVATSGGKSLIISIVIFYTLKNLNPDAKFLLIVPSITLVTQFYDSMIDFNIGINKEIDGGNPNPVELRIEEIMSDKPRKHGNVNPNVYIGTYQSLEKWPKTFFQQFHTVAVDECLHPDSMISMSNGEKKKISDIKIGEFVKTINEKTLQIENKEVEKIHKNISLGEKIYEIELENGSILKITGNHKVFTKEKIWKRIDELNIDDDIIEIEK